LFGYSRGVGEVSLPRAMKFTASLYSLGIPPEIIGTGRGLREARDMGLIKTLEKHFPNLHYDLKQIGKYINKENLELLISKDRKWEVIREDIDGIEEFIGCKLEPERVYHKIHRNLVSSIMLQMEVGDSFDEELEKAAKIRKSIG
jgi:phosphoenolpyruvate carboxylase